MKTSCFKRYTGDMGVSICLYPPITYSGVQFPSLAPDRQTFYAIKSGRITNEQYTELYYSQVLSKLDPNHIWEMFKDCVLLCWEEPIFDIKGNIVNEGKGFCHRHIVSKWLSTELHVEVKEWAEKIIKKTNTKSLF
jgi:hypothetical protein